MTWVLIGMQSSGKSTFMERLLNAVLNIVQEGTGTRCPLDVTCIYNDSISEPNADLSGEELDNPGVSLSVDAVFQRITEHNKKLGDLDVFSSKSLRLVYRASNVQNMRFVDTPGIISNQSTGNDNRDKIKAILVREMVKPNTKLCVLLETATEYAKNPILKFLDESLGSRESWINDAKFLMPKFEKQMEDSRTANKANNFFREFTENGIYPHLIVTPTLEREDLPSDELFKKRTSLLARSNNAEKERFADWMHCHEQFRRNGNGREKLNELIQNKIGFPNAQAMMQKEMLEHTLAILPEVIDSIQQELSACSAELKEVEEKLKFTDPAELRVVINDLLHAIQEQMTVYLDGDLRSAMKYDHRRETLDAEIEGEEDFFWADRELDHYSAREEIWRSQIAHMKEYPNEIQPEMRFVGGKQVQRAIEFFGFVLIDSLPDPFQMGDLVRNAVGYGQGGLMRENWEGATKQICMVLMEDITHPGINYVVKHIGYILRRLFRLALADVMDHHKQNKAFRLVPKEVIDHLENEFNSLLWSLMEDASEKMHVALEPLHTTVDPHLPTFLTPTADNGENVDGENVAKTEETFIEGIKRRCCALVGSFGAAEAKQMMTKQTREQVATKKGFLHDKRSSMITAEETELILKRSFQYLVAMVEFYLISFRLQVNCYLYEKFKRHMKLIFLSKGHEIEWNKIVVPDTALLERKQHLKEEIKELENSLHRLNKKL